MAYQPTDWEHGDIITGGKLNKIEQELTHVADNATYGFGGAQLSSDGLTPFSYINAGDPMPANPQKGDTVFLKDGNDFLIYSYNGEDWVLKIDPDLSNRIEETIKTASDNTDKAIADNNTQINETINQVAKEQADLAVKDGDFNNKAQAMADKALSDAKANTATVAQETLNSANDNIADAKKSVTDDIAQEASDRASAVGALDTKAQGYADTAKKNAIDVATSADGVINKKIDDTASSITSTVSQNKMDAEGKITTAQSTATQALNGLSSKVDTSTYNTKTGQLSTDVTNVTQTANQAKTDIASIKQTDTTQDARMTTIEADASGTKATVSNLQTAQGQQSGSISTLQQRADGFDATVTKVNNLRVGSRNLLLGTLEFTGSQWYLNGNITGTYKNADTLVTSNSGGLFDYTKTELVTSNKINTSDTYIISIYINNNSNSSVTISITGGSTNENGRPIAILPPNSGWKRVTGTMSFWTTGGSDIIGLSVTGIGDGGNVLSSMPKFESGTIATDWTPAPEDTDNKFSAQQVTIDGITNTVSSQGSSINSLTTRVQTAEGTLSTATNNITGLQSKQTQTANQITQEISDRTNGDSNTLQSSKDFTTSSVSSAVNGVNSTITQTSDSLIAKINTKTDSDTVLSLLKDNWSIGITDNISKITSGIVGNASQMSLISKNVTIDSPNTQIKGTAWIQSAMIANGAIGSAQIGDATITSAKIATLDVAKLTGNVSSFIQSNWNGSYGSTQITDTGMTVTSKSPRADLSIRSVFDANGLTMYTPKGTTVIRDGETAYISSSNEDIGMMGTVKWGPHPNVDYLMVGLHGYHTTTPGDSSYDKNSDGSNVVYGGDGIGFGISNVNGGYDMLMTWDSPLVADYQGRMSGWHVEDVFTTHLMSYAAGGLKVSSRYSEGERSLHTEGLTINNNSRWFGFLDGSGEVGFGTDQTRDVWVFIKGKPYSMYAMLDKLRMLR